MLAGRTASTLLTYDGPMARKSAAPITPPDASMRVVVLHGTELFLLAEYSRRLAESLREAHGDIEQFEFDGAQVPLATVLDELRSWGLMQTHKLVILDNASDFMKAAGNRPAMERYAQDPMSETTFLLRSREWRPGNFDKAVKKVGAVIKCDVPREHEAVGWCMARGRKHHSAEIDRDAAELLVERIGPVLSRLDGELAKLAASVDPAPDGDQVRVTRAAVVELVGLGREEQAWLIQDTVLSGSAGEVVRKLHALYQVGRAPSVLLMWALLDLARKLNEAARRSEHGESRATVAKALRLWGPSAQIIPDVAGRLGSLRIGRLFQEVLDLDARSKTGRMPALSDAPANRVATLRTLECVAVQMADRLR